MPVYRDAGGDSNVAAYELGDDFIIVEFNDGSQYEYTFARTGQLAVHEMSRLAARGEGLNAFINTLPKHAARKLR